MANPRSRQSLLRLYRELVRACETYPSKKRYSIRQPALREEWRGSESVTNQKITTGKTLGTDAKDGHHDDDSGIAGTNHPHSLSSTLVATSALQRELNATGFSIFRDISDLGYFSWKPGKHAKYKKLAKIQSAQEIRVHVQVNGKPDRLVAPVDDLVSSIPLPQRFVTLPEKKQKKHQHYNTFPYGQFDVACLHVATQHRSVQLDEVDFAFGGGSTLKMLATRCSKRGPYLVTRVPTANDQKNCLLVVTCRRYNQNYAAPGFQFERLITGKPLLSSSDPDEVEFVQHLQMMQVGNWRVLIGAQTDAMDYGGSNNDEPVEVKTSNQQIRETDVMFQMISSGSTKLCYGIKRDGGKSLTQIGVKRLGEMAQRSLSNPNTQSWEENILRGMDALKAEFARHHNQQQERHGSNANSQVYKVHFDRKSGELTLIPVSNRNSVLLPPLHVVQDLIRTG